MGNSPGSLAPAPRGSGIIAPGPSSGGPARFQSEVLPALCVLFFALAVPLVRAPLPIDETRYLEVFRESLNGSPLLLRLLGEPYAEKTPLLFWLGRALGWLSIPPWTALRLVPGLASALTVFVVARLGTRAGLSLVGWVQAAFWIPLVAGQFLAFDPLVALGVWCTLDAWVRRRTLALAGWSAFALLAKGPVALLFLIPFLWAMTPLAGARRGDARRAALVLALAFLPLAAWAVAAAVRGGPEFANALLWERWAGRIGEGADHSRSLFFYLPVVLLGALPGTLLFFRRTGSEAPVWVRRLGWALALLLLCFTLISGKQAHYLVPAAPGLALYFAWRLEADPRTLGLLRTGVRIQLALVLGVVAAAAVWIPRTPESFGARGHELLASGGAWLLLGTAGALALASLVATFRAGLAPRALLALALLGGGASLLPLHRLAGELLFPHALAAALRADSRAPLAFLGTAHHGIYALLAGRELEKLVSPAEVEAFCAGAPGSLLVLDPSDHPGPLPGSMRELARDVVHRSEVQVWRVAGAPRGPP